MAVVDGAKLTGYLLDPTHKVGWHKGRFLAANGFDTADIDGVRAALLAHCQKNDVAESETTPYGTKYRIDGPLEGGLGLNPLVRTVWQIDAGQAAPRFVTMRPLRTKTP